MGVHLRTVLMVSVPSVLQRFNVSREFGVVQPHPTFYTVSLWKYMEFHQT